MQLVETKQIDLGAVICFIKEVSNANQIKAELERLVDKLKKSNIKHKNLTVTKVIDKNPVKKTVLMEVSVPIDANDAIGSFIETYPKYSSVACFKISSGYKISIPNNMNDFKAAVEMFLSKLNENPDLDSFDLYGNPIIEVAKIAHDGTILGFDLYLENKCLGGGN